ncbi:hypothetical protein HDU67_000188 [Dinochytrium kinnereticum]|nr:hypothetical protein HDU67_000188 [Dinochytrium kinnereticum]
MFRQCADKVALDVRCSASSKRSSAAARSERQQRSPGMSRTRQRFLVFASIVLLLAITFLSAAFNNMSVGRALSMTRRPVQPIPRKIWTFWHTNKPPRMVLECVSAWKRFNPDHTVTIITPETIPNHIKTPTTSDFEKRGPSFISDWVRLAVLYEQGGVWMDASIIATRGIDHVHDMQQSHKSEAFAYHLNLFTTDKSSPVLDSWFIASIPRGKLITAWFNEFNKAFTNFKMEDTYLDHLQHMYGEGGYKRIQQGINWPSYLMIHIAGQKVITMDQAPQPYTEAAEDGPYKLLFEVESNDERMVERLLTQAWDKDEATPMIFKLRASGRGAMSRMLEDPTTIIHPESIYARFLNGSLEALERSGMSVVGLDELVEAKQNFLIVKEF